MAPSRPFGKNTPTPSGLPSVRMLMSCTMQTPLSAVKAYFRAKCVCQTLPVLMLMSRAHGM